MRTKASQVQRKSSPCEMSIPVRGAEATEVSESPGSLASHETTQPKLPGVEALTIEQKVAQVLCPFLSTHRLLRDEPTALESFVGLYGIGFLHVGQGNLPKTRRWIEHLQALAIAATGVPIACVADCEQGLPQTFRCGSELPWAMALGASQTPEAARTMGRMLGEEARAIGVDVVFGPCVDVNTNPLNKAIASRSFGGAPELVAAMGVAFVEGLQEAGVAAVPKHFPGHGTATEDSHLTLPEDPSPAAIFESIHLPPFQACIAAGAMGMMAGHLYTPALDVAHVTSVSHKIMTGLLRETLAFEGVLFTDSLNKTAIQYGRSKRKAMRDAFAAGCDVLVHPAQADRTKGAMEYLLLAIDRGTLTEARLDQAVGRILAMKRALLPHQKMPSQAQAAAMFQSPARIEALQTIASNGVTLLTDAPFAPLSTEDEKISLVVAVDSDRKKDIPQCLTTRCQELAPDCETFLLTEESSLLDVALLHKQLSERDGPIVLAVFSPTIRDKGRTLLSDPLSLKLERLTESNQLHTAVVFGSPYILLELPAQFQLCAYGPAAPSEHAVANILFGRTEPGRFLPVIWPDPAALAMNTPKHDTKTPALPLSDKAA